MNKLSTLLASTAIAAVAAFSINPALADQALGTFPNVDQNTNGPSVIITFNPDGSATTTAGGSTGPYDGADDTFIGVINNSPNTINSFNVSAAGTDIFGFDGDGIDAPQYLNITPNAQDSSGYGGPDGYFTNIDAQLDGGTVNFIGGIASGREDYFSLEEAVSFSQLGAGPTGVPEPMTMSLFGAALVGAAALRRRSKKKA
jgi:hypothetical protein